MIHVLHVYFICDFSGQNVSHDLERFVVAPTVLEAQEFSVHSITWKRVLAVTPGTL